MLTVGTDQKWNLKNLQTSFPNTNINSPNINNQQQSLSRILRLLKQPIPKKYCDAPCLGVTGKQLVCLFFSLFLYFCSINHHQVFCYPFYCTVLIVLATKNILIYGGRRYKRTAGQRKREKTDSLGGGVGKRRWEGKLGEGRRGTQMDSRLLVSATKQRRRDDHA